jgi:OOP family OmpA-OmpF porin
LRWIKRTAHVALMASHSRQYRGLPEQVRAVWDGMRALPDGTTRTRYEQGDFLVDKTTLSALLAAGFSLSGISAAAAADEGFYVGASVGQAYIEAEDEIDFGDGGGSQSLELDGDDVGFKIFGGYMFSENFGIEAGYVDFGSQSDDFAFTANGFLPEGGSFDVDVDGEIEVEASGFTVAGVGVLPVGPVDLFAKVGLIVWDADASATATANFGEGGTERFSESDGLDGEDLMYGVGASWSFGDLAVRAEYENYDIDDVDSTELWSIGITYRFTM